MLTVLQEKLAEAHGLAIAASVVTAKVAERVSEPSLLDALSAMQEDADETRARCVLVERTLPEELYDEVRAHAISTKESAADLVGSWFKAGTDPLRAWAFLTMGEAAEVATWRMVATLSVLGEADDVGELAAWALPVQNRHLELALDGAVALAERFDPAAPRWG
jgi:hypothetical protein